MQEVGQANRPTNTMAIVSLIFGILGVTGVCAGIGPIVALITGNMAMSEIRNDPNQSGDGLAKIGIILGWIGVGLMVLTICFLVAYFLFFGALISSGGFESYLMRAVGM